MILQKLCPEIQSIEIFESMRTSRTMISLNEVRFNGVSMLRFFMQLFLLNIGPLLKVIFLSFRMVNPLDPLFPGFLCEASFQ